MKNNNYDVVIIGAGVAGLYAALELPREMKVLVLAKERLEISNSYLAQGGIAAAIGKRDKKQYHIQDTINAGSGINEYEAVETIVNEAEKNIDELHELGVAFDKESGEIALTKEGGHSRFRILHIDGDATGKGLVRALMIEVQKRDNLEIMRAFCEDLIIEDGACVGIRLLGAGGEAEIRCQRLMIATGGIGAVYGITTNALGATGDGIAMAKQAGAIIKDMEFVQFHPTVYYSDEKRRFLISEAVRGEGALLRNEKNERFMPPIDKRAELAPRDIVSRAIYEELKHQELPHVFLDATCIPEKHLLKRFPSIFERCMEYGQDMRKDMIPVSPAQHYGIGGIRTDLLGRTSIDNLYACGESACTGVHGANRLASNSLLEAVVFAKRAAKDIQDNIKSDTEYAPLEWKQIDLESKHDYDDDRILLQETMTAEAGIVRTEKGMRLGLRKIAELRKIWEECDGKNRASLEMRNLIIVSECILEAAIERQESVGTHFVEESDE
jgi:L-aspartate oxidase